MSKKVYQAAVVPVETAELRVIVDKQGRTFERGAALTGMPGVVVSEVRRTGSYVTVVFGRETERLPPPMLLHMDDVQAWEEVREF